MEKKTEKHIRPFTPSRRCRPFFDLFLSKKKNFFQKQQTVRYKCFAKCVTKPSTSLSSGEQTCLSRCCDRYSEATQVVLKSVLEQSGLS